MTGWVNYEQKEYAIAFDADRRCVYLDRNAGEKLFVTGKSCGTFYCYAAVLLSGKCDPAVAGPVDRQNEEKAKQEQEEKEKALQEEEAAGSQEDTAQKGVSDSNG